MHREYKYLGFLQALFICILLVVNLIGAGKVSLLTIPWLPQSLVIPIGTGIIFFPLSYLLGDLLTEVYGYHASRRVIWTGFGALIVANLMVQVILHMPASPDWHLQKAYEDIFSISWRITVASIIAFAAGEFANSYVMAKMKLFTKGSKLWARTIGSTICGEALDTLVFYPLAFLGSADFSLTLIGQIMLSNYVGKVAWEVLATPLTYLVVGWLKKAENEDYYDSKTDFNPFHLNASPSDNGFRSSEFELQNQTIVRRATSTKAQGDEAISLN
ncbi:MAG: queuosine precursor transporter [Candidatus Caenarcaniphilales bacterium]|nr:queuosine precursor transporter [Candidatus Caenarcaniphilales bacterium]